MKQIIQSFRTGEMTLLEVPRPVCKPGGILVKNRVSLISVGTEKMLIDLAQKSLLGKAKARPDLVRQVYNKIKQEGLTQTLEKVFSKLDTPIPLGYSCTGEVVEVSDGMNVRPGDRVACAGAGYANHSEFNFIPKNLFVKVPDEVDDIEASFVTVASIALQGVRQAVPTLGEVVAVLGLGLLGQITCQLLKANGCRVIGVDLDQQKCELAEELGADVTCFPGQVFEEVEKLSTGRGADAVIITASTPSDQPVEQAGEISKQKGRVVVVGMVGMNVPRSIYYAKELQLSLSMSYGPGRYDYFYEEKGIDYPFAYVRWTEQRNFETIIQLLKEKKLQLKKLITHSFSFNDSLQAFKFIQDTEENTIGVVLEYEKASSAAIGNQVFLNKKKGSIGHDLNFGVIGAGNFTRTTLLPRLKKLKNVRLKSLVSATGITAGSVGRKFGFENIATDFNVVMKDDEINAVIISTPHNEHAHQVIDALKNRKHVFVEKPLCLSYSQLLEIEKAYEESTDGQVLQVGYNRRFSPFIQKMSDLISGFPVAIIYRINAGVVALDTWYQDLEVGGGRLVGEVCHFIDTAMVLTNSHVKRVFCSVVDTPSNKMRHEDNLAILLEMQNGSTTMISYTALGNNQVSKEQIEVMGDSLYLKLDNFKELLICKGSKRKRIKKSIQQKGFDEELGAFVFAIKEGTQPRMRVVDVFHSMHVIFAIKESIQTGKPVSL